jgi:7,8-dihydropterin-6-yl-methyl-4-(beta-D-ribofuranosyl)aminobenzene 5'-phosphate synthase
MRELPRLAMLALILLLATACSATQSPGAALLPSTPIATSPPVPTRPTQTPVPVQPLALPTTIVTQLPTNTPGVTATPSDTPVPEPTSASTPTPRGAPTGTATGPQEPSALRITIVYDNTAYDSRLQADWGFAAWLEYAGHVILFDTGAKGDLLLDNMAELDLDPHAIEMVVLSHEHGDHTGGLDALLDTGARPVVYAPASFSSSFKKRVSERTELVEIKAETEILPGVHSTGQLGDLVEQALVVETGDGQVVITGCAHPGILRIVRKARRMVEGEIALVIGGFHLGQSNRSKVESIIAGFRVQGVRQASPAHCTGERAIAMFAEAYGEDYVKAGAGRVIAVGGKE